MDTPEFLTNTVFIVNRIDRQNKTSIDHIVQIISLYLSRKNLLAGCLVAIVVIKARVMFLKVVLL